MKDDEKLDSLRHRLRLHTTNAKGHV